MVKIIPGTASALKNDAALVIDFTNGLAALNTDSDTGMVSAGLPSTGVITTDAV